MPEGVNSAPQIRHVLARDETLDPQLGQVLGWVSESGLVVTWSSSHKVS